MTDIRPHASQIPFDNAGTSLTAERVQAALAELDGDVQIIVDFVAAMDLRVEELEEAGPGGGIGGSTGSVDNAVLRANGTGGATAQASAVKIGDAGEIAGYRGDIVDVSGTTHTLDADNTGKVHVFSNSAGCAVTAPNTLPAGWCCSWIVKSGAASSGDVSFAVTGGTLQHRQSHAKAAGAKALGSLVCESNAGTAPQVYLAGDTKA